MSEPALRRTLYQELLDLPEHLIGEIFDGELYTSPRPAPRHAVASSMVGDELMGPFHRKPGDPRGPGGWWVLFEPELHLGEDIVVPDLAGWRRERLPRLPDTPYFSLAPDWVCEVLSPSTERIDRVLKKRIYAREGLSWLWLVNPLARTLEVLRREGTRWLEVAAFDGNTVVRAEPFDAIKLELARWWEDGSEEPG